MIKTYKVVKKGIGIQSRFKPGSSEFHAVRCSYQLNHWSSGIEAEDRWHLSIDTVQQASQHMRGLQGKMALVHIPLPHL